MSHHCHAMQCRDECEPRMLMCGPHWRMVPKPLQVRVYKTFNPLQCREVKGRPAPSGAWMMAAEGAILAVWLLESPREPQRARQVVSHHLKLALDYATDMAENQAESLADLLLAIPRPLSALQVLRDVAEELLQGGEVAPPPRAPPPKGQMPLL